MKDDKSKPTRRGFLVRAATLPAVYWVGRALGQPNPPTNLTVDGQVPPPPPPPPPGGVGPAIVPALGRTVWNPGIYEGIPSDTATGRADGVGGATQHGATLPAGSSAATIQAALAAAAAVATPSARKFVKLGAGLFSLSSTLNMVSYVTLRGTLNADGFTRDTVLRNTTTNSTVLAFRADTESPQSDAQWGAIRTITTPTVKDGTTVTVNDASNFNVGDIIHIDTLRDGSDVPPDAEDNGALPIVYNPPNAGNWCWTGDTRWFMRLVASRNATSEFPSSAGGGRAISEVHEVLAKNGNVLTVYNPNAAVIRGSPCRSPMYLTPQAYLCRGTSSDVRRYAGLEDLKIEPNTTNGKDCISMNQAAFCWVKNVEIHGNNPNTTFDNAVWMHIEGQTYRCEVTGCYFHGFDGYGPGGAYGIRIGGSEHYIHNNVLIDASKPVDFERSSGGTVVAYNYVDEARLQNGWQELAIGSHASFCHYELVEGNWTANMGVDSTHGNNGWFTFFRNFSRGCNSSTGSNGPSNGPLRAVNIGGWQREIYCIGNVLIDPVLADNVRDLIQDLAIQPSGGSDSQGGPHACVYLLGTAPVLVNTTGSIDDWDNGEAGRNFHRHLDYNAFSASQFDNPLNLVKTLPNSLHRTTAPSYFTAGGFAWPWVNPAAGSDATRVMTLPAKARYDAGTPFTQP